MEPGLEGGGLNQMRSGEEAESRAEAEKEAQALMGDGVMGGENGSHG